MKVIGLIGGMSWESTAEYYRVINQTVKERLGGLHSAKILLYSVDFSEIATLQTEGKWPEATTFMCDAAQRLERGGADCVLICTNTMHKMAEEVQQAVSIPLLHIADATAAEIEKTGVSKVALLGTQYTMEEDFYKGRLAEHHGLEVMIPPEMDRNSINEVIYNELCLGKVQAESKNQFIRIIKDLAAQGAKGIILGCTEISLLIHQEDIALPLFDTTAIHAKAAVEFALGTTDNT
ncbi:MAG: aspartate/glutamate racemase family protein [Deltaproteobacteria bacterium]|nr:MAG: aspartate/glutamate racemase family protein [Deltaproteobacteria bacterium]